jgi:hypothetical protein
MPIVSADQWATKMLERIKAAGSAWETGVQNPRRSPTAQMKAAAGKWKANMQAAINADRWAKKIANLTDESIRTAALKVGSSAFINGITAREDKVRAAVARLQPKVAAVSAQVQGMPQNTDGDREQRMLANLRGMRGIRGS